jgi:hypothetical protein
MILGATDQKLWVFEVFGQGLAKVGMCWSQPARVDQLAQKVEGRKKKIQKIGTVCPCVAVQVSTRGWRGTTGRPPTADRHLYRGRLSHFLILF